MSKLADRMGDLLREVFPFAKIIPEHYVKYKGQKLFVDYYVPSYLIAIEVHGRQHDEFVEHFHKDDRGWRAHRRRDRYKEEWASLNGITYIVIRENDAPNTKEEMLALIRRDYV